MFMKKIGNIVVNNNKIKTDVCFNKCLSYSDIDKSLPTLIIGLEKARVLIDNFNILKKSYNNDMLWWTFSKTEKRNDYESDTESFFDFCLKNAVKNVEYENIDLLRLDFVKIKRYINWITSSTRKILYIYRNRFIFIYDTVIDKIYGYSLDTSKYCGIDSKKIGKYIKNNKDIVILRNFNNLSEKVRRKLSSDIISQLILSN